MKACLGGGSSVIGVGDVLKLLFYQTASKKIKRSYALLISILPEAEEWEMRLHHTGYGFFLLIILLLCLLCQSTNAEDPTQRINWTVEKVIDGVDISEGNPSIAVDEDGGVHICYHETNASALMYAYRTIDGEWSIEVLDNSSLVGKHNSMTIDSDGIVHIVYLDYEYQNLKYARKDLNGRWMIDSIDTENLTGQYPSLKVDSSDGLHVVYYSEWEQGIKYAHKSEGQEWHISMVYSDPGFGCIGTDLQIDSNDLLHLAYVRHLSQGIGNLFYASKPVDQPWDFNETLIDNAVKGHISLAVEMKSNLHISYTLHHGGAVQANKFGDHKWYTFDKGLMENLSKDVSNGVTSRGQQYICGWQYPPKGLGCYYETEIGSVRISLVDPDLLGDLYTALVIDGNDQVHIAYTDIDNNRLMYATDRFRPPPPEDIRVVVGDTFVSLDWDPPSGWESNSNLTYNIYKRSPETVMVPPLFKSGVSDTHFFDENVRRRETYVYWLASVSDAGEGHLTGPFSAIPTRYPTAPTDVDLVPGDGHVILSWKPPIDNQSHMVTGYRIHWQEDYVFWERICTPRAGKWNNITIQETSLSFNHSGLKNGNTYFYEICAIHEGGEGERSNVKWTMPLRPPSEPYNLTGQIDNLNITISWNRPLDDGGYSILKYKVYRAISIEDMTLVHTIEGHGGWGFIYNEPQTLYRNVRLVEKDPFKNLTDPYDFYLYYQIGAVNGAGEGLFSDIIQVPLPITPEPPMDVKAIGETSGIRLMWSEPITHSGLPITGYIIQRRSEDGNWTAIASSSNVSQSYVDSSVIESIIYEYRIIAFNDAGEGEPSDIILAEAGVPDEEIPFQSDWNVALLGAVFAISLVLLGAIWYLVKLTKTD